MSRSADARGHCNDGEPPPQRPLDGIAPTRRQQLLNYIEYVRRSLSAVSGGYPMPPHFPAPDARREEGRPWVFKPEEGSQEPDLAEWHFSSRLIGKVKFTSGKTAWYGPNGLVAEIPNEHAEAGQFDE
jgi:hypothetical protein